MDARENASDAREYHGHKDHTEGEWDMSNEQNKAVVRRFMSEFLAEGKLAAIDEVLGPTYVNRTLGADLEAFKGFLPGITALPVRRFTIEDLVAEGDSVVARFTMDMGNAAGETVSARA
jgi:predicted ester cyclase